VKLRVRHTKLGKVRFTSHRDLARMWERALRRAGLPVASSEGFTPRPRIGFGLALPTGAESVAEYVDIDLRESLPTDDLAALPATLSGALPNGIDVVAVAERTVPSLSLQEAVTSCTWELWGDGLEIGHHREACRLLDAASLVMERERKGKRRADDVRPAIVALHVGTRSDVHHHEQREHIGDCLVADLATGGRGLRPSELAQLAYPDVDPLDVRVLRTHQWIDHDGTRRDVLPIEQPQPAVVVASPIEVLA
jgi:radical SAM-linked protein